MVLNFCLSVQLLIFPSNLNESLTRQNILGCNFFSFIILNTSCHSLPVCRVPVGKSANNLVGVPLYFISHFSLVAFIILSLSLIFVSLIPMCLGVFLPVWNSLKLLRASWIFLTISSTYFLVGRFSTIMSSNISSDPFSLSSPSQFSSVQSLSRVQLLVTPWIATCQASLFIISPRVLLKLMPIESVMPSKHLILCHPLLLSPSIFPRISVFSNQAVLPIRWPKYWHFSFNISPSNEYSGLISFRIDSFNLPAVQGTLKSPLQHHSSKASIIQCSAFFMVQVSHPYMTTGKTIALTTQTFVGKVMSRFLICCLGWSQFYFQGARIF